MDPDSGQAARPGAAARPLRTRGAVGEPAAASDRDWDRDRGERIARLLEGFETVSLQAASAASLMERVDRKFLLPSDLLGHILNAGRADYRALVVQGSSGARYSTSYYDTPDLRLYLAHHAGRLPRQKVRIRWYMDSGERYLEVKHKTNKGRTLKTRVLLPASWAAPDRIGADVFAWLGVGVPFAQLEKALVVDFTRVTLVRSDAKERITFDLGVRVSTGERSHSFPGVVIAEFKQERSARSPLLDVLRGLHLREGPLSKYCLGIATLRPEVKANQFKEAIRRIESIDRRRLFTANG